jgi:hypothetical protein
MALLLALPAVAMAFAPANGMARMMLPSAALSGRGTGCCRMRMIEGTDVAAAGFVLFNVGYVAQLLVKPR